MDFSWTAQQTNRRAEVSRFAKQELSGGELDDDRAARFPLEKWSRAAEFGLTGLRIPQSYGGHGLDMRNTILTLEALGYGCTDNGLAFALNAQACIQEPIIQFGSEEQRLRYLPALAAGTSFGAFGFTEPDAGSDLYNLSTHAVATEGGYLITGHKSLITFGPIADVAIVFATTNPELREWGLSAFLVDLNSEGVTALPNEEKMGLRTVPLGQLKFEDCFVSEANLLGQAGGGLGILNEALAWDRCIMCATQLGAMQRQLDTSVEFARTRQQFGQPIGKFQSVSNRIAEMKVRLESSRLLLYQSAWKKDAGDPILLEAAMAKLHLTESAVQSGLDAIAIHGGVGYLSATEIERDLRDAIGGTIYAGTSDIQRNTIAKLLGL